ncbi:MAG: hypothetical protein ABIO93_27965 [Dyadobacter sp.]|uniref:hypothetical protein n=1 Tax=Dyadobacter sp. TaxID=1914288 RepID=UPI0032651809
MKTNCNRAVAFQFFVALSFAFVACDNCSDTVDAPVSTPITFSIVDPVGNNLVDTSRSYYSVDSVKLFDIEDKEWLYLTYLYVPAAGGYVFSTDCRKNSSGKSSLILKLNSMDSDTLDVWYKQKDTKCFTLYEYTYFQHNGKDLRQSPLTSALLITKAN